MSSNNSQSLYLSELILKLEGEPAPSELMDDVLEVYLEESLHRPAKFTIRIHNAYLAASKNSEPWRHQKHFKIGDRISIGFAASTTKDPEFNQEKKEWSLFEGEITAIGGDFNSTSESNIVVQGCDISHRFHRGRHNRSFENKTDSDIVKDIADECRIQIGQLDPSDNPHEYVHEYVFQENQTNMEFLRERAARIGFELFVQDNKLYFRQPKNNGSLQLKWLTNISSFNVRVDSAEQVSSVEVRSWDYSRKQLISKTATTEEVVTSINKATTTEQEINTAFDSMGSITSKAFKNFQPPKMVVVDQPCWEDEEAEKMAQAVCNELGGEYVYANAKAEGNPKIRPGKVVELEGMGLYSGKYYVTETRHIYSEGVYHTEFSVRGLREGTLLSTLAPKVHLQPGQTLMVGIVTENNDKKGWGRVRVKLPTLNEDNSNWARVVGLGAANERGCYWLPEIGDEVLVGFEHGDIHRPYIIGGVWNGVDKTVEKIDETIHQEGEDKGKVRVRTIKSRTGHKLQFVEETRIPLTDAAGIYLESALGNGLSIDDSICQVTLETLGLKIPLAPPYTTQLSLHPVLGAEISSPSRVKMESLLGISMEARKIDMEAPLINLGPPLLKPSLPKKKKTKNEKPLPSKPLPPSVVTIVSERPININPLPVHVGPVTVNCLVIVTKGLNVTGALTVQGSLNVTGAVTVQGPLTVNSPSLINGKPM